LRSNFFSILFLACRDCSETFLLDLKHLLKEANQKIPPILRGLVDPQDISDMPQVSGVMGCGFCGGLGHRITECPKLAATSKAKKIGTYGYDTVDKDY
jgi:ATP-dependent RNA helicase DDX41